MAESIIEIEFDLTPIRYKVKVEDPMKPDKDIQTLKSFVKTNDVKLIQAANEAFQNRQKISAKQSIQVRLPGWFYTSDFSLSDSIALLMFFVDRPMNTRQLTGLVNREVPGKKKDLRNVSKHLTSKGKSLYGYTVYDPVTQTYALNEYGKRWVGIKLLAKIVRPEEAG